MQHRFAVKQSCLRCQCCVRHDRELMREWPLLYAMQILVQAGEGAYLAALDSAVAARALQLDAQLQLLMQRQAAAQQSADTISKVKMGTVSPEFGQEPQPAKAATTGQKTGNQVARVNALQDKSNTHNARAARTAAAMAAPLAL